MNQHLRSPVFFLCGARLKSQNSVLARAVYILGLFGEGFFQELQLCHGWSALYGDSVVFFDLRYYLTSAKTFSTQILELNQTTLNMNVMHSREILSDILQDS